MDKTTLKAVKEIEDIIQSIEIDPKLKNKEGLKRKIKRLNKHVDKLLSENLGRTEQLAFGKTVSKAQSILKKNGLKPFIYINYFDGM